MDVVSYTSQLILVCFLEALTNLVLNNSTTKIEGQLGLDSEDSATFIRNAKLDGANITSISSGSVHTLFLGNGQPWSTGYNQHVIYNVLLTSLG